GRPAGRAGGADVRGRAGASACPSGRRAWPRLPPRRGLLRRAFALPGRTAGGDGRDADRLPAPQASDGALPATPGRAAGLPRAARAAARAVRVPTPRTRPARLRGGDPAGRGVRRGEARAAAGAATGRTRRRGGLRVGRERSAAEAHPPLPAPVPARRDG